MKTTLVSAICTPLDREESLHKAGLEAHLEDQWSADIPSVLVGGSMGCMQLLRDDTYVDLVRWSVQFSRGRGEILVGVGDASFARTRDRIGSISGLDIDGVVVIDPYLFKYDQDEQLQYYHALADNSSKPLYIYHLPARTGAVLEIDTIVRLSQHPNIRGIKCAKDAQWIQSLLSKVDHSFRVMVGQSTMMEVMFRVGVREFVDGVFSVFPRWAVATARAAEAPDNSTAMYQAKQSAFVQTILARYPVLPACTAILNARGIPGNCAPRPMRPLDQEQRESLLAEPVVMEMQKSSFRGLTQQPKCETNGTKAITASNSLSVHKPPSNRFSRDGLSVVDSGLIFRNTVPHLKSVHAYFPSVICHDNGEMLATFSVGEAFESPDLRLHSARSQDGGKTWHVDGPLFPTALDRTQSEVGRVTITPLGEVIANVLRMDRTEHPDEGMLNPETKGFVPGGFFLSRSNDVGRTWSKLAKVRPPLVGPEFEMCSPITMLQNGQWLWPTSTWPKWRGDSSHCHSMVTLFSDDAGESWPRYSKVMADPDNKLMFLESKVIELPGDRLLAVAWCYDREAESDLPNQYALSYDNGDTWSERQSTGLYGQTMSPLAIDDTRFLIVYRRMDKPGLWVQLAHWEGNHWVNDETLPLWGQRASHALTRTDLGMARGFQALRFGAPHIIRLSSGEFFVSFWCYEDNVSVIRWITLRNQWISQPARQRRCSTMSAQSFKSQYTQ